MRLAVLQIAVVLLLSIVIGLVHQAAILIVANGFGVVALICLFASLPLLSRYLD